MNRCNRSTCTKHVTTPNRFILYEPKTMLHTHVCPANYYT